MTIDQSVLDERVAEAASFLARVLARYIAGLGQEGRAGHCEFRLENPNDPDRPIGISTRDGEITLWFGECHDHFSDFGGASETDLVGEMVVKVVLLISGGERNYSIWEGDACLGGGWLRAKDEARQAFHYFPRADRLKVVGWCPWDDTEIRRDDSGPGTESPERKV